MSRFRRLILSSTLLTFALTPPTAGFPDSYYAPTRRVPESLEPLLRHVTPGDDAFPEEKDAFELSSRLSRFGDLLKRDGPSRAGAALSGLLAPGFKGGRLTSAAEGARAGSPHLEIRRDGPIATDLVQDAPSFVADFGAWFRDLETVHVAEFLVTAIESGDQPAPWARSVIRYDVVGSGKKAWREEHLGQWQLVWTRGPDTEWRVAEWTALDHVHSRSTAPMFTDLTGTALGQNESFRAQLGPEHDSWLAILDAAFTPDTMALHGVSAGDVDGDGLDDVYLSQPSGLPNRLFRNRGDGTFADVTAGSGLDVLDGSSHSLFGDLDNDGDQDVVLVVRSGLLLFRNDGRGHFTRDAEAFRFKSPLRGSPITIGMADYDRDGFLDIYLGTYSYFIGAREDTAGPATPYHDAQNGPPDVLFRNDGHGRFVDVTDEVGLDRNNDRFTLALAWGDYDSDGWPDLLVANDFGRKNLFRNGGTANGPLRFKDVAAEAAVEDHGAGMSATWFDYDHDGDLDLYTGNMWTAAGLRVTGLRGFMPDAPEAVRALYRRHARGNSLFRNRGDGTFEDATLATRTAMGRWAWSADVLDFDLDGWEDLYVTNGMFTRGRADEEDLDSFFWRQVTAQSPLTRQAGTAYDEGWRAINRLLVAEGSQAPHERNVFLRNDGRGGFDDVSGTVGLDLGVDDRSFVVLDYDHDGDPDVLVYAPRASPQLRLFRNERPSGHAAIVVRLVGTRSNRDAIGARVTVESEGTRLVKSLALGSGFLSQHSKELTFGLGKSSRVVKVTVQWPNGLTQVFADVPANRRVSITEGDERPGLEPFRTAAATPSAGVPEALPVPAATWLYEPCPAPDFTLVDLQGKKASLSALRGRPALLLLWAAWEPASRAAFEALSREHAVLTQAGIGTLTLALDGAEKERDVRSAAGSSTLSVAIADATTAGVYSVLNRFVFARRERLPLPTALLLNDKGEIVKVYREAITASSVTADVPRISATPAERLARALPFKGTFYSALDGRHEFSYALDLAEQGFEDAALTVFERVAARDPNAITLFNLATLYTKRRRPAEARASLEQALSLKPDYAEANNTLGALLAQNGDVPGGIARFRAALAVRPEFADAVNNLGFALFQTGQEQQAYELYQKALSIQPEFPEALNNLGIYYGQGGDLERAGSYFKQALAKRPDYGEAANNLALVQAGQDDTAGAVRTLQHLLEKDPGFEAAYVTLAKIYLAAARPRDAVQVLEQLLQHNPGHTVALQILRQLRTAR